MKIDFVYYANCIKSDFHVTVFYVHCLWSRFFTQYDPDGEWGELKVGQHQSQVAEDKAENRTVSHYFPLFLNDLSLCVRVEATNFVTR